MKNIKLLALVAVSMLVYGNVGFADDPPGSSAACLKYVSPNKISEHRYSNNPDPGDGNAPAYCSPNKIGNYSAESCTAFCATIKIPDSNIPYQPHNCASKDNYGHVVCEKDSDPLFTPKYGCNCTEN